MQSLPIILSCILVGGTQFQIKNLANLAEIKTYRNIQWLAIFFIILSGINYQNWLMSIISGGTFLGIYLISTAILLVQNQKVQLRRLKVLLRVNELLIISMLVVIYLK